LKGETSYDRIVDKSSFNGLPFQMKNLKLESYKVVTLHPSEVQNIKKE
jgi:hypothetical protein